MYKVGTKYRRKTDDEICTVIFSDQSGALCEYESYVDPVWFNNEYIKSYLVEYKEPRTKEFFANLYLQEHNGEIVTGVMRGTLKKAKEYIRNKPHEKYLGTYKFTWREDHDKVL